MSIIQRNKTARTTCLSCPTPVDGKSVDDTFRGDNVRVGMPLGLSVIVGHAVASKNYRLVVYGILRKFRESLKSCNFISVLSSRSDGGSAKFAFFGFVTPERCLRAVLRKQR